jgi:hypothetical protein
MEWITNKQNKLCGISRERKIPTERRLLVNEISANFWDRGCRTVSTTDPHGRILCFLDRSHYYFYQLAPQLHSRGWAGLVPDPLLLRKSGSFRNRTRDLWICSQKLWPLDRRGGHIMEWITFEKCKMLWTYTLHKL